jgi:hypothetical protein
MIFDICISASVDPLAAESSFSHLADLLQYDYQSQEDMSGGIVLHDEVAAVVVLEAARDRHLPAVLWIRIRTGNADPDPEAWKLTKIYKKKPGCRPFFDLVPTFFVYFSCKNSTFCDLKV